MSAVDNVDTFPNLNVEPPHPAETTGKRSVAAQLVDLAHEQWHVACTDTGEVYAVERDGANLARPLRGSGGLRAELAARYFDNTGKVAGQGALADALLAVEGAAHRVAPIAPALRTARHGGALVVDLGNSDGDTVIIEPGGWRIVERSPVLFARNRLTAPLPRPAAGHIDELRQHIHVSDDAWPLLVAWAVTALDPAVPCPGLLVTGQQGAAKSTTARRLQQIVDPSTGDLHGSPDDVGEWKSWVANSRVVALDNLSGISGWLSDAICRAVTGGGLVKRALYSDNDLVVIKVRRALVLTSIDAGSLRGDLADRLVPVDLEPFAAGQRRSDQELDDAFDDAWPRIIAGLYTLTAEILATPAPPLPNAVMPRMIDYARKLQAVDAVLGTNGFATYMQAGHRLAADVVEGDTVARAVRQLVEQHGRWSGTAAELLDAIRPEKPSKAWPADATRLAGRLRRVAPALAEVGVDIDLSKANGRRRVELRGRDASEEAQRPSASLPDAPASLFTGGEPAGETTCRDARDAVDAKGPALSHVLRSREEEEIEEQGAPASLASLTAGGCTRCGRTTGLSDDAGAPRCSRCRLDEQPAR